MNQMTPITRKYKAKKDSFQEKFENNVELVGIYDNAEDMVKDLEQQAKKPKRKVRFETEPEVANMVEQPELLPSLLKWWKSWTNQRKKTLCTMTYKCLQQLRVW